MPRRVFTHARQGKKKFSDLALEMNSLNGPIQGPLFHVAAAGWFQITRSLDLPIS